MEEDLSKFRLVSYYIIMRLQEEAQVEMPETPLHNYEWGSVAEAGGLVLKAFTARGEDEAGMENSKRPPATDQNQRSTIRDRQVG